MAELQTKYNEQKEALRFDHPWRVRPTTAGHSYDLDASEVERLRTEQGMAAHKNIPWKDRGPVPDGDTPYWRGQPMRRGINGGQVRYAKRGGKNQEFYRELAKQGKLRPTMGKAGKGGAGKGAASSSI